MKRALEALPGLSEALRAEGQSNIDGDDGESDQEEQSAPAPEAWHNDVQDEEDSDDDMVAAVGYEDEDGNMVWLTGHEEEEE